MKTFPQMKELGSAKAMAKDSVGGQMLIGLASENKLPKGVYETVQSEIFNNPDLTVRVQAGKYFKARGAEKKYSIEEITSLPKNAVAGKLVFQSRCTTCHRVGNEGNRIGPDLSLIRKKLDRVQLLDAIINPSAGIVFGYEPLLINTTDGESVLGFLVSENKQTLVIRDVSGALHTLPLSRISSRKKQETSLMPGPSILGLSDKDLANLAEYLLSLKG